MSESLLTVLKFCLLALVYLFLARVVWVVSRELRGTPVAAAPGPPLAPDARKSRKSWKLATVEPDSRRGEVYTVDRELTIGRGGGCAVTLPVDTFVSQVHARVFDRDGELWVEDLKSTNGTFVNGKQISSPTRLRRGDRVQIGETVLEAGR